MAQIAATEANAAIVELWRTVAFKALFAPMVAKNRILNVTQDIAEMGDILHIKINPKPTVGNVTAATGAFTAEAITITNIDLTVNLWKYVAHDVVDIADVQSDIDLIQNFSQAFVPAIGEQIETDILALWSSATTNAALGDADSGTAFGDDLILPAILVIDNLDIPETDRSFILPPVGTLQLMKNDKFVDAHRTGLPKGAMTNGVLADIYGNPAYKTSRVATSGNIRKGLYLHRNGLAVGIQRNIKIEKFARTQFSTPFAASVLYATGVARNNHTQVLNIKTTLV